MARTLRVLIAGGGVAALEALLALRVLAGPRVAVTLLAPDREFVVRASSVGEPFDRMQARTVQLAEVAESEGAELVADALRAVDTASHAVVTAGGERVPYDVLMIATGALATEPLEGAVTFRGRADVGAMREVLDDIVECRVGSVAFALTRTVCWSLPLYELALLTATHAREHGVEPRLEIVTPEPRPLDLFGPAGATALRPLLREFGIALRTRAYPRRVEAGGLLLGDGQVVPADRVVTMPVLEGPRIKGLPADSRGFIPVDRHGRVRALTDVYAAGDVTTFPIKQGGLAAQQADAVAEAIAARAGALVDPEPFRPVIRGLLFTATGPVYLRAEPGASTPAAEVAEPITSISAGSNRPLWWPPAKVAGRYLAPYLATARPSRLAAAGLVDRPAPPTAAAPPSERRAALEMVLALADADARWGDHASALRALEAAEALEGGLSPDYETKRVLWRRRAQAG